MRTQSFELVHVGSGQFLDANCIVAVASPTSFSIKKAIKRANTKGNLADMTHGRKVRSAIFIDDGRILLTSRAPEVIAGRLQSGWMTGFDEDDEKGENQETTSGDDIKQS